MTVECDVCGRECYNEKGLEVHQRTHDPVKPWHDEETLRRLYIDEGLSYAKIAKRFGCSQTAVGAKIREYGINDEKDCREIHPRKDEHPHFKRFSTRMYGGYFREQAARARKRDGEQCVWCGVTAEEAQNKGLILDVHHITPAKSYRDGDGVVDKLKVHSLSNLVTVCRRCHSAIEPLDEWQVRQVLNL